MMDKILKVIKIERTKKLSLKDEMFVDLCEMSNKYLFLKYKYKSPVEDKKPKKKVVKKVVKNIVESKESKEVKVVSNQVEKVTQASTPKIEVEIEKVEQQTENILNTSKPAKDFLMEEILGADTTTSKEDINYDDIFLDIN